LARKEGDLLKMLIKKFKCSPDFAKSLIIRKKEAAMTTNNTFSLSLQKQIQQKQILFDSEIN